jgi:serpin B
MTYAGARENTARQMAEVLHFDMPAEDLPQAFASLDQAIEPTEDAGYELAVANALWGMRGYAFVPQFLDTLRSSYQATFQELDFGDEAAARQTINAWVEEQTRGKIKDLIPPRLLDGLTRLVLTNAIYFKGAWATEFDPKLTKEAPFTMLDGNKVNVALMHRRAEMAYAETDDAQVVELPYKGDDLGLVAIVPRQTDGLPALEARLSAEWLASTIDALQTKEVLLFLPRFKIEAKFGLSDTLQAMGMTDAFSASADLTGIGDQKGDLYIKAVLHKAFVEVNEEGTEAAAATAVVVTERAMPRLPEVRADHPFLFVIRHKATGAILFMGRLSKPAS